MKPKEGRAFPTRSSPRHWSVCTVSTREHEAREASPAEEFSNGRAIVRVRQDPRLRESLPQLPKRLPDACGNSFVNPPIHFAFRRLRRLIQLSHRDDAENHTALRQIFIGHAFHICWRDCEHF